MKTRAAVAWEAGKPLEIEMLNLEGPKAGEVLLRNVATGVCHTDAFTLSGEDPEGIFPAILGHEGGAVVEGSAYYEDAGLDESQMYYYRVAAVDSSGNEGAWSGTLEISTNRSTPAFRAASATTSVPTICSALQSSSNWGSRFQLWSQASCCPILNPLRVKQRGNQLPEGGASTRCRSRRARSPGLRTGL